MLQNGQEIRLANVDVMRWFIPRYIDNIQTIWWYPTLVVTQYSGGVGCAILGPTSWDTSLKTRDCRKTALDGTPPVVFAIYVDRFQTYNWRDMHNNLHAVYIPLGSPAEMKN